MIAILLNDFFFFQAEDGIRDSSTSRGLGDVYKRQGQYLQPSVKHFPLQRYYDPSEFKDLEVIAKAKGFLLVSSSPLTRSSYHADEDFAKLKKNRITSNAKSIDKEKH